jgi:hypothetical protein
MTSFAPRAREAGVTKRDDRDQGLPQKNSGTILPPPSGANEDWHVTAAHAPGSVEHFYHFLLGFFIPLVHRLSTERSAAPFNRLIIRGCGPLDRIIHEFGDDRIRIVEKELHRRMAEPAAQGGPGGTRDAKLRFVTVHGCDDPAAYNKRTFTRARKVLLSIGKVQSELHTLAETWPRGNARILLIERGPGLAFYGSERSEQKGSGQDRRSIANHDALYRSLRRSHANCLNVMTETLSLARQIALFSLADVIIAQHGAALANIVWARPPATVIEILPDTLAPVVKDEDLFGNLSRCMGLRYRRVPQDHEHSDVDVGRVGKLVAESAASPGRRITSGFRAAAFRMSRPGIPIRRKLRSWVRMRIASDRGI